MTEKNFNKKNNPEKVKSVLLQISHQMHSAKTLEGLCKVIHKSLSRILPVSNFYVALYDEKTKLYSFPYFVDEKEDPVDFYPQPLDKSLTNYVRKTNKPLLADSIVHKELYQKKLVDYIGPDSKYWLGAPLSIDNNIFGVIVLQSYDEEIVYTKEDLAILKFVANNISSFILRFNNEEELKKSHRTLEQKIKDRTKELIKINKKLENDLILKKRNEKIRDVIFSISQASNTFTDLSKLFKFVHQQIKKIIPVKNFYVALLNEAKTKITFPYFIDEFDKISSPIKFGDGITSYLIKNSKNLILTENDIKQLENEKKISIVGTRTKIWIGVVLKISKRVIGALVIQDYKSTKKIGKEEEQILTFISEQVAVAINRKRNEEQLSKYLLKLEQNELKLKKSISSKDKFFSIIAHDLKSPFQSLLGISELLENSFSELTNDEKLELICSFRRNTKNLSELIENLLNWAKIQTGKIEVFPEKIYLENVVNSVINLLNLSALKKNIKIKIKLNHKGMIFADKNVVETLLRNFISNAIKFSYPDSEIIIKSSNTQNFIKVTIIDFGVGIEKESINDLFRIDVSSTTLGTASEKGNGLGLPLCKDLIEISQGKIIVKSEKNYGSKFSFMLPCVK